MVKVVTKRKRGRPQTKYKKVVVAAGGGTQVKAEKVGRVIVTAGGTQVKPRKLGRLKASSILFSPIKDSLKKAKRVLDTKELARQYLKKVRTKK